MKMICDWIVWYFHTCMFVQLHSYVWGRMLRRGCTGREQNNITFCITKSWQSFYQHVINKAKGSDDIDKCIYMLYIPLLDKEENIRPRVSDVLKTCAREIAETFEHSENVFRNTYMLKKSTRSGWPRTEWLGELDNPVSFFSRTVNPIRCSPRWKRNNFFVVE